ncbi:hypothetical protein ABZW49_20040 [Nonomuraea wenchangensis]
MTRTATKRRATGPRRPECPVCFRDLPEDETELALHRWDDFTFNLRAVVSYALTYAPPADIPDNYMPVSKAVAMLREVHAIMRSWESE